MQKATFAGVVLAFGAEAKAKFDNPAVSGAPEDQLRAPLERLFHGLAALDNLAPGGLALVGETTLSQMQTRPDYAVSVANALVGFIEVKAPGKGCDPRKFSDPHDKAQWSKLKSLPNLVYTDGNGFSLWRNGEPAAKNVLIEGDIETAGAKLKAPETLRALAADFLSWAPQPPASAKALAHTSARLRRLLREEVLEEMAAGHGSLRHLKEDWRKLLFPEATNEQFADGYAQAVTFGLLTARAFDISLKEGVELAAIRLKKTNTLIGTALNVLTEDEANQQSLKTSLGTLTRVLNEVNWSTLSKDKPEAWLYFYEHFLEVYDNRLRKLTGSYYTPPEVMSAMVDLVDQALRGPLFERAAGLASSDVTLADPAVGTGTFLLGALRRIAANVEKDQGAGAVGPAIAAAAKRLFGFELQFGPFAVAQLRLLAEMRVLTKTAKANQQTLKTSLGAMARVLNEVNWPTLSKDKPEAWLNFYEHFLEVYDNRLRKLTGSYYTPPEVVEAMTNLVDQALRGPLFERVAGLASSDVTLADPAVGTGTFLLGALRRIAANVEKDQGAGAVGPAIAAAAKRLFGFELQFGPFAVAQLRLLAEIRTLTKTAKKDAPPALNLFITDTLGNPFVEEEKLWQIFGPIAQSRREANRVKREQPITVVIGNPPYKEKAEGRGGWIEEGSDGRPAPLDLWRPPHEWGAGKFSHKLKNLYVYFWRWATLKVFGSGRFAATGRPDTDEEGIVCFITVAGFLNGPGFERMRDDLRRTCSDIWVIDCSPEGHQPDVPTRIFQGVQQPVCIVLAARKLGKDADKPAQVKFRALPKGRREDKFKALAALSLDPKDWVDCPTDWRAPFLPEVSGKWADFLPLPVMFAQSAPGVTAQRTWPIAPDTASLVRRWDMLRSVADRETKRKLFGEERDRTIDKIIHVGLGQYVTRDISVGADKNVLVTPIRYGFRTFDPQWIIPDHRLISMARPTLWSSHSNRQVYLTALEHNAPTSGAAISMTALIPDKHHYKGSFGGRVYPLWADAQATQPNIRADVLQALAKALGATVAPEDLFAYIAAIMAHPAFTARFKADLVRPGLRLPLTADKPLFDEATALGREVVWLHCYGERFVDSAAGRPKGPPRLPATERPTIPAAGAIPGAPEPLPDTMDYDAAKRRLVIGKGFVENVTPAMCAYEISGKNVLDQWFSYRRRDRTKPMIGDRRPPSPLEKIQPDGWLAEYTEDLLNLLNVLGRLIALEPRQADLLDRIVAGPLVALAADKESGTTGEEPSL